MLAIVVFYDFTFALKKIICLGNELSWPIVLPVLHNLDISMVHEVSETISAVDGLDICSVSLRHVGAMHSFGVLKSKSSRSILLGVSTIVSENQIIQAKMLGAGFVSSMYTPDVFISLTNKLQIPLLAGVSSAEEAYKASNNGANSLKFYPSTSLSPATLRHILQCQPTLSKSPIIIAGNIHETDFYKYLNIGVDGFAIGIDCNQYLSNKNQKYKLKQKLKYLKDIAEFSYDRYIKYKW